MAGHLHHSSYPMNLATVCTQNSQVLSHAHMSMNTPSQHYMPEHLPPTQNEYMLPKRQRFDHQPQTDNLSAYMQPTQQSKFLISFYYVNLSAISLIL